MGTNTKANRHRKQSPGDRAWPTTGYIGISQMMSSLAGASHQTVYNYINWGLIPAPERIGLNRVGWPVDVARQAIADLPESVRKYRAARARASGAQR